MMGSIVSNFRKSILHVMPAWARCGSTSVFQSQLKYLEEVGYDVVEMFVAPRNFREMTQGKAWEKAVLDENPSGPNVVQRVFLWPKPRNQESKEVAAVRSLLYDAGVCGQFVDFHCSALNGLETSPNFCRSFDVALVNHAFTMSHVRKLLPDVAVVLETHDIQTLQMRYRGELIFGKDFANNLKFETGWWKMADHLVSLNPDENDFIVRASGKSGSFVQPPILEQPPEAKYDRLGTLLAEEGGAEDLRELERIDLLLMGDWHPLNVEAFSWFFRSVLPIVRSRVEADVLVCGRVVEKLGREIALPGVYKTGFLKELANINEFAKIIVLPDQAGTGISIKLREALAADSCFAPTKVAMRGMLGETRDWPTDPVAFAEDIVTLLSSPEARAERRAFGSRLRKTLGWEAYKTSWNSALAASQEVKPTVTRSSAVAAKEG